MKDVKRGGGKRGNDSHHRPPGRGAVVRVTGAPAELSGLAAEFPGYEFATQQTWEGVSIIATRHGGCAHQGLYVVVTGDLDEMRRALLEHERSGDQGDGQKLAALCFMQKFALCKEPAVVADRSPAPIARAGPKGLHSQVGFCITLLGSAARMR
jgi:hypothetical protein